MHLRGLVLLVFLLFIYVKPGWAQASRADDLKKLAKVDSVNYYQSLNKGGSAFMRTKGKSFFANYNPLALTLKSAMFVYQNVISVQLSADCLYSTSCSNFSKQAISEFGLIKGIFLTSDRLLRCNPYALNEPHFHINENGKLDDSAKAYRFRK